MLSYRHAFHAGNFADVLKHIVLIRILRYMTQKDKPLMYVDTHAGAGTYKLDAEKSEKTGEYRQGISLLWELNDPPEIITDYIDLVRTFNFSSQGKKLAFYPGSPWFAQRLLRQNDRLVLNELHPADFPVLKKQLGKDSRIRILQEDGYKTLNAVFPPVQKRGLVLIDPSYEQKQEYQWVVEYLAKAYRKFPTGTYVIWYPVVDRQQIRQLEKALLKENIPDIQRFELGVSPDNTDRGMTASGMIVINPPWTLMKDMNTVLPCLADILGGSTGHWRADILASDKLRE